MKEKALSPRAAVQLAGIHTWPASVLPVLLGVALAGGEGARLRPWDALATLAAAVLLQSAVNTLNDCRDFASGLDSAENCCDPSDAALLYEHAGPRAALALGFCFLAAAAAVGGALAYRRGAALLLYGGAAALAIGLYVLPGVSASELPLGEALSGVSMGGVLTAAAFHIQAGYFGPRPAYLCLPAVLTVGCIMLANNASDMEKDRAGGRRTLPVLAGRAAAQALLRGALLLSALLICIFTALRFPRGIPALSALAAALPAAPAIRALYRAPLSPERRRESMAAVLSAHARLLGIYIAAVLLHRLS